MLVILADLSGKSAEQDAGIANLFLNGGESNAYRVLLKDLLESSLTCRKFALESLQKMAKDSKSEALTTAIRELIPAAPEPQK